MAYIIKTLLPTASLKLYKNVKSDPNAEQVKATNIVLCNTSGSAVTVNLSFYNNLLGEGFQTGAVVYGYSLAANQILALGDRIIYLDDEIFAFASTVDVIALSMDILGDDGRYYVLP